MHLFTRKTHFFGHGVRKTHLNEKNINQVISPTKTLKIVISAKTLTFIYKSRAYNKCNQT